MLVALVTSPPAPFALRLLQELLRIPSEVQGRGELNNAAAPPYCLSVEREKIHQMGSDQCMSVNAPLGMYTHFKINLFETAV